MNSDITLLFTMVERTINKHSRETLFEISTQLF